MQQYFAAKHKQIMLSHITHVFIWKLHMIELGLLAAFGLILWGTYRDWRGTCNAGHTVDCIFFYVAPARIEKWIQFHYYLWYRDFCYSVVSDSSIYSLCTTRVQYGSVWLFLQRKQYAWNMAYHKCATQSLHFNMVALVVKTLQHM